MNVLVRGALYIFNTFQSFNFLNEFIEPGNAAYSHYQVALEQATAGIDGDVAQDGVAFFVNHRGDVGHDADVVMAHNLQRGGKLLA